MARTWTAMKIPPQTTACTTDGTPYRSDWTGIVHVLSAGHVAELAVRGFAVAFAADLRGHHSGVPLIITTEA